jgi:CysZ protein
MSYPLESRGLLFAEQKNFMQQNRIGMLSFGGIIGFGLTLPVVNLLIAQAAVIGATLYVNRLDKAEAEAADGVWR